MAFGGGGEGGGEGEMVATEAEEERARKLFDGLWERRARFRRCRIAMADFLLQLGFGKTRLY